MSTLRIVLITLALTVMVNVGFAQDDAPSSILETAKSYVQASSYEQALKLYNFYIRFHPDNIDALSQRAVVFAYLQNFDRAFEDTRHAFDIAGFLADDQAIVYNHRGQVYFVQGETEQALQDFSRAIEIAPTSADYWLNRGLLHQVLREWDNALADYEQYLSLSPDNSEVYLNIAQINLAQQNIGATITALDSAIKFSPDDPELYIFRGSINLVRQSYSDAAADYQSWMTLINEDAIQQSLVSADTNELVLDMDYGIMHRVPFKANSGDRLGVLAGSTTVDSLVVLLDPNGVPIMADDDGGRGLNSFFVDFTLPEDGVYTLIVGHARGGWTGEIELTIQIVPAEGI